jgi:glycosyltransferase involved in cell wall biosynthesis
VRILVEVISAEFGGIRTYVEHLLRTWERTRPDDELVVVVPADSTVPTFGHRRVEVDVPRPAVLGRPLVQTLRIRRIAREHGVDAVLATLPSTSLVRTGLPTAVVVYDLRHELRPEQFTRSRRLLRNLSYGRGYAVADTIVSISRRTLDDLHRLHPRTRRTPAAVVHLGADHVLDWPGEPRTGPAVTFAHHTNKNPDLILDGWAAGNRRGPAMPDLLVLGTGSARERLQHRIDQLGLSGQVELAPFLPDEEFARVLRSASMVVFPSDFEGFGLPVVEGMLLGIPVVIGPEPATSEVAGGHAAVLADWTPDALADAVDRAGRFDAVQLEAARAHAAEFTWARVVEQTRSVLEETAGRR